MATPATAEGFVAARWVNPETALTHVSHDGFRAVLNRAFAILNELGDPHTG